MAIINSSKNFAFTPAADGSVNFALILNASQAGEAAPSADASFDFALILDAAASAESAPVADSVLSAGILLEAAITGTAFTQNADALFDSNLILAARFESAAFTPGVEPLPLALRLAAAFSSGKIDLYAEQSFHAPLNLNAQATGTALGYAQNVFASAIILAADVFPDTALALRNPAPITNSIAAGAFPQNQKYAAQSGGRLSINDVLTPFVSAEINAPRGSLGKSLRIELAKTDLAQLAAGATFKFEVEQIASGSAIWKTIVGDGFLSGRQYSTAFNRDSLIFQTTEGTEKLNVAPLNNFIVYDPSKTEVSVDEIEPVYTNTGEYIGATKEAVNVLSLYKLLNIAFVSGCGFPSVSTDIPNYEIARCDFSASNTYAQSVSQFIGVFEPVFSIDASDNLIIQKTVNPLPPDFTPESLTASKYPSLSETADYPASQIDGYLVNYIAAQGTSFVDRTSPDIVEQIGTASFGSPDFVERTTSRKYRDWYESGVKVRSELKEETVTTRRNGDVVGVETKKNLFDALSRSTGYTNTIEARLPDTSADNTLPALLKTREEAQKITYKTNPFAPRATVQSKIETDVSALLAIDSDNTALDASGDDSPYKQDYEKVFEAGNLKTGMTSEFKLLETTTERFRPLQNGQVEVRVEKFDYLRNKPKPPVVEIRSGDFSVLNHQKQQTKVIFKSGVTQAARTGKPLAGLNVGELPLFFAEPLADWLLANARFTSQIELVGFDETIERGASFNLRGRESADFGNYLIAGYSVRIRNGEIKTTLDAVKV